MNKFSNKLTDCRSRLLDAEAVLHHLHKPENLHHLLEECSPEVTIGAMIDKAWELVGSASGDCEAMVELQDEQFIAEHQTGANVAPSSHGAPDVEQGRKPLDPLGLHAIEQMAMLASDDTANLSLLLDLLMDMEIDHQANGDCPDYITESRLSAARYAAKILANKCCESTDRLSNVTYEVGKVEAQRAINASDALSKNFQEEAQS